MASAPSSSNSACDTVQEIDPDDDAAFLRICSQLGLQCGAHTPEEPVSNPTVALRDTQRAELMLQVKDMLAYYGVIFPYDLDALLEECRRAETQKPRNNTSPDAEIKIEAQECLLTAKKEELEKLRKESADLRRKQEVQRKKKALSPSCREIVMLAQHLGLGITHIPNGVFRNAEDTEYVEDFHALFLPFVSLSVDAVNLVYAQIEFPGEQNEAARRRSILNHISYLQMRRRIREGKKCKGSLCVGTRASTRISHPFNMHLLYSVLELALSAPSISISQMCQVLSEPRENIMQEVFALCFHSLLVYNRALDEITMMHICSD